jgi:FkbM family methyltransferase
MRQKLLRSFAKVEQLATASRLARCMHAPLRYIYAMFCRYIRLPLTKAPHIKQVGTFFNRNMSVRFPSGTDIYLTGGKTDNAELRLTRFLLMNITEQTHFIDIGAHFGYYSLLAETCCAKTVTAIEPSAQNFGILKRNAAGSSIIPINTALSDEPGHLVLSEFPGAYSEYNTAYPDQFKDQKWFARTSSTQTTAEATTLDLLFSQITMDPVILKIDAEGSEYDILKGARQFLQKHPQAVFIIEYICDKRDNSRHRLAVDLLTQSGFACWSIQSSGDLTACPDIEPHMQASGITTDNLVFKKLHR